jgi:retron-type reverse transcriptase
VRKVQALQSKLSHAAKQSLDRRFGALYDKIYREDVLWVAWNRVRANKGAPGIDGESIEYIEEVIGVEAFLEEIREELHSKRYRPKAVRRCWIDKPGKPEKRPLVHWFINTVTYFQFMLQADMNRLAYCLFYTIDG